MPGAFSDYLESGILHHLFRTGSFPKPGTIAVALCGTPPADTDKGDLTGKELADAGGYARQVLAPDDANWDFGEENGSGYCVNLSDITFPVATADWGWVSGVAVLDSGVHGAGHYLVGGALKTPKLIQEDDQFKLSAGDAKIYLD